MRTTAAHRGLIPLAHPLLRSGSLVLVARRQRRARSRTVKAVFDQFTERAIKVVVFTPQEAKGLGKDMVFTQHLLPGLVAEERSPVGFLRSGITTEVTTIWKDSTYVESGSGLATDVPFLMSCKSVFESEVGASKNMGCKSCVESGCCGSLDEGKRNSRQV